MPAERDDANGETGAARNVSEPPFTGENPCPECRPGICHRCGQAKRDAWIAPHMGVVLCSACFYEGVAW